MSSLAIAARDAVARLRTQFPSLTSDEIFLENAGGSQVPTQVVDAIREFMMASYVQVEAGYAASNRATEIVKRSHAFANAMMNGEGMGQTVIQPSSSQALRHLADAYGEILNPGDEIVVAETGHEANIGPWLRLERLGARVIWWKVDPNAMDCTIEGLLSVISDRTKLVVYPQVSNLLGTPADAKEISRVAHDAGARVVVDGVASAPHLAPDVKSWDCDWYVFSHYKVFGPHVASLFGKAECFAELTGPNHYFIPKGALPSKFTLGCPSYEAMAGLLGTAEYLKFAAENSSASEVSRTDIEKAFELFRACERAPLEKLLRYLNSKSEVRIVGRRALDERRVGIVSFVHASKAPSEIVAATDAASIGIRSGNAYAPRLCEALGLDPAEGVVRVSLAHYNTVEEIERLISVLDGVL